MAIGTDRLRARVRALARLDHVEVRVSGNRADEAVALIERVWQMCLPPCASGTTGAKGTGAAGAWRSDAVVKVVHGDRCRETDVGRGGSRAATCPT